MPIERRSGNVIAAASRVGAGRVLRISVDDTWRRRMTGEADGVREHRAWWTDMVSRVAYAPSLPRGADAEGAPYADFVSAIGSATAGPALLSRVGSKSVWTALLFLVFSLALIGEVGSRRRRGAS